MPYRITWEPRGVYRQYFGHVTIAERFESFESICRDPRFDDLHYALTDYLLAGTYEVTPEATEEIAAFHVGPLLSNPRIVIAAVATRSDVIGAIHAFMAHSYVSAPYRVHPTVEQARAWIESLRPRSAAAPVPAPPDDVTAARDRSFDRPLQPHEALALAQLSMAQLASVDAELLEQVPDRWCRSAVVVARAARRAHAVPRLPLICYTDRLLGLAASGSIEVQGDLRRSRQSFVRQPAAH